VNATKKKPSHMERLLKREWWARKKGTFPNVLVKFTEEGELEVRYCHCADDKGEDLSTSLPRYLERPLARLVATRMQDALNEYRPGA
jgi:hypothetical protein